MKKLMLFCAMIIGIMFSLSSFADMKIGVVDIQKIMQSSPAVTAASEKLRKEFSPQQDKIMAKQKEIKDMIAKLKRDDSIMRADDKKKLQDQINDARKSLDVMAQGYEQNVMAAQQTAMQQVISKINDAVTKIAKGQNLNMVVAKQAVLYLGDGQDITDDVMKELK